MPGGFGTMDEFFEAVTLTQTKKISQFPIIIFDKEFHKNLIEHIENMRLNKTISDLDTNLFLVTDSSEEAIEYIRQNSIVKYGLKPKKKYKPLAWLFEKK